MTGSKIALAAALMLAAWLVCGCGGDGESAPTASATPVESPYHDVKPPEEYFGLVPIDLAELDELNPEYGMRSFTQQDYQAALAKLRANGPEALSDEEWRLVVAVSWYAYVMQAQTIKYRVVEWDASSQKQRDTLVEERYYQFGQAEYGLVPLLVARHMVERDHSGEPSATPSRETPADETIDLYELTGAGGEKVILTQWERQGEQWTCQRGDAGGNYVWGTWLHFYPDLAFVNAEPAGTDVVEGRPAYRLRGLQGSDGWFGDLVSYWQDVETVLPSQYEYRKSGPGWGDEEGNTQRFTILEVNGEVDIQPPNVDVPCVEEDFEP